MELWKTIDEAPNYEISTLGRVRNLKTQRVLNPGAYGATGYKQVNIAVPSEGNKQQKKYIHRLVAQYWIPNPENKKEVNHIDGDKLNNSLSNLEWVTSSENQLKRHAKGNIQTSHRRIGQFTLTDDLIKEYPSIAEASRQLGKPRGALDSAVHGRALTAHGFKWKFLD